MASREIEKFIMVAGESGVGKSTIINMLFNQDSTEDCCKEPCPTGSTADSVTKSSSVHINMQRGWCFVDTIGIGDPEMTSSELVASIRTILQQLSKGVDLLVLALKMERVPMASRANMALLRDLFGEQDLKTNGVLVLTHWDGELGDEHSDLEKWIGQDTEMKDVVDSFAKVILTNNNLSRRGAYPECRRECLAKLNKRIEQSNGNRIYARPVDVVEFVNRLLDHFKALFWRSTMCVHNLLGSAANTPIYCGICAVCTSSIKLEQARVLPCNHTFHKKCISNEVSCALCRHAYKNDECRTLSQLFLRGCQDDD